MANPFGGTLLNSFSFCCVEVIAPKTDNRLTLDLIFEAVPYSSANIFTALETCSFGLLINKILEE
jgi:hypothetical protein